MSGSSGKSVEPAAVVKWDSFCSSELLCNVIKRTAFCLWEAEPHEGEGEQSHSHKNQVDV